MSDDHKGGDKGGRGNRTALALATGALALAAITAAAWTFTALRTHAATPPIPDKTSAFLSRPGRAAPFSLWIEDLPVMPGLTEQASGFSFEMHEGGRLAQARLAGAQEAAAVRRFYAETLASLGWRAAERERSQQGAGVWRRGRERLVLVIEPASSSKAPRSPRDLEATFVLSPDPTAPTALAVQERRT